MELHHSKHHQTYVTNLNKALASYAEAVQASDVPAQIALQAAIRFNGGGHINHSLFWKNLAPSASEGKGNGGVLRDGPLKDAIVKGWGSLDNFKKEFNATTAAIQGSGWGWLVSAPVQDRLIG